MSAWIVSKTHIDAMVTAMVAWELIPPEDATRIGRLLWEENVKSIHARYPDTAENDRDYPGPLDFTSCDVERYEFEGLEGRIDPLTVWCATRCWTYQTCEYDGCDQAPGWKLVEQLKAIAERKLPEFNKRWGSMGTEVQHGTHAFGWGIDYRDAFLEAEAMRAAAQGRTVPV